MLNWLFKYLNFSWLQIQLYGHKFDTWKINIFIIILISQCRHKKTDKTLFWWSLSVPFSWFFVFSWSCSSWCFTDEEIVTVGSIFLPHRPFLTTLQAMKKTRSLHNVEKIRGRICGSFTIFVEHLQILARIEGTFNH